MNFFLENSLHSLWDSTNKLASLVFVAFVVVFVGMTVEIIVGSAPVVLAIPLSSLLVESTEIIGKDLIDLIYVTLDPVEQDKFKMGAVISTVGLYQEVIKRKFFRVLRSENKVEVKVIKNKVKGYHFSFRGKVVYRKRSENMASTILRYLVDKRNDRKWFYLMLHEHVNIKRQLVLKIEAD